MRGSTLDDSRGIAMLSKRPRIFISSTIHDFADLRSAIKFYLEERGCEALLSEFNDFGKPVDTNSYDACIKAIDSADYFVLLIGAHVGGWYDEAAAHLDHAVDTGTRTTGLGKGSSFG